MVVRRSALLLVALLAACVDSTDSTDAPPAAGAAGAPSSGGAGGSAAGVHGTSGASGSLASGGAGGSAGSVSHSGASGSGGSPLGMGMGGTGGAAGVGGSGGPSGGMSAGGASPTTLCAGSEHGYDCENDAPCDAGARCVWNEPESQSVCLCDPTGHFVCHEEGSVICSEGASCTNDLGCMAWSSSFCTWSCGCHGGVIGCSFACEGSGAPTPSNNRPVVASDATAQSCGAQWHESPSSYADGPCERTCECTNGESKIECTTKCNGAAHPCPGDGTAVHGTGGASGAGGTSSAGGTSGAGGSLAGQGGTGSECPVDGFTACVVTCGELNMSESTSATCAGGVFSCDGNLIPAKHCPQGSWPSGPFAGCGPWVAGFDCGCPALCADGIWTCPSSTCPGQGGAAGQGGGAHGG